MRKKATKGLAPVLDNLIDDGRLARLFSDDGRPCALQLWILQVKSEQAIDNHVLYGRLLPYSHASDRWSATDNDDFQTIGQVQAQVIRLNLYLNSDRSAALLRQLSTGHTLSAISEALKLGLSDSLNRRFGTTTLVTDGLVYRPVAYLLNRDAHEQRSPASPHGGAGAFSASISQTDKGAPFRVGQDYSAALTAAVVKRLNADTGLDFGSTDTVRFGDLELLVFPALDDMERALLSVRWSAAPCALVARFNPTQVPHFRHFQFRLNIATDEQIVYSGIAMAEPDGNGVFECKFEVSDQLRAMTDSTELEIFGFQTDQSREGTLCSRWRTGYCREIHIQGHVAGAGTGRGKFDWLEKTTRPSVSARVDAALTINRSDLGFGSQIGGRDADPWVPINRELVSLFRRLHPPKSEGQFFLRWGQDDGEGRLQLVEWFKALLAKHRQHQVVIFDPYFEAAGLGLLILSAVPTADYIVFRSLPKAASEEKFRRRKADTVTQDGINNLLANCAQSYHLLQRIKLRIYGLKEGRLHDRYILIMGQDGLPVAGFHLSNSLQSAAENHPLLVTPIPADVLLKVDQYKVGLVKEAASVESGEKAKNPNLRLLFDSAASPTAPKRYERLRFLDQARAGDVLGAWAQEPSLRGLSGATLKKQMTTLGLLRDESLVLSKTASPGGILDQLARNFADFKETWEVLGEALAHSRVEVRKFLGREPENDFLEYLAMFLQESLTHAHGEGNKELAAMDSSYFLKPIAMLLHSSYRIHHFFHSTKYAALTWPEFFTIKLLWQHAPATLLTLAEEQIASLPASPQNADLKRLSVLGQIVSEVSLSIQLGISDAQRERLLHSSNGLLYWMGLSAIEQQLDEPDGLSAVLQRVNAFPYPERVRVLGWMVQHTARDAEKADTHKGLIAALHEVLPSAIPAEELVSLIDSMRGHMHELGWAEPWLFPDVIFPLLQTGRANIDDACAIWVQELSRTLEPPMQDHPMLFDRARDGQTTIITAFLFAESGPERQQISLKAMQAILKRKRRIVQQPLASTSNWTQWDIALTVSLWILAFSRWGEYYLRQRGLTVSGLERLAFEARELAMVRPLIEWRSQGVGEPDQLAAFLGEIEDLLATPSNVDEIP